MKNKKFKFAIFQLSGFEKFTSIVRDEYSIFKINLHKKKTVQA